MISRSNFRSKIWVYALLAVILVFAVVFLPLFYVSAESIPVLAYKHDAEYVVDVYANGQSRAIARVELDLCVNYYAKAGTDGVYNFGVGCYIYPEKNRGTDVFQVDGFTIKTLLSASANISQPGVGEIMTFSKDGSETISTEWRYENIPYPAGVTLKTKPTAALSNTIVNNYCHYSPTTTAAKDADVAVGFYEIYAISNLNGFGYFTTAITDLSVTGIFIAPDYNASNTEQITIYWKLLKNGEFEVQFAIENSNDTANPNDTLRVVSKKFDGIAV